MMNSGRGNTRRGLALLVLATLLGRAPVASAQPAAPSPPAAPSSAPPPAPSGSPAAIFPNPPPIVLDDAMLSPVPRAGKVLNNWKEALQFILARSIDVATAEQEVRRAEGLQRQALALALPSLTGSLNVTGQIITPPANGLFPTTISLGGGVSIPGSVFNGLFSSTTANPIVTASITASVPILAPRAWHNVKTTELGVASNKLSLEDKKRTIFIGVANAIITVFTAERTAEVNRSGLRSSLERLYLTKRQLKLGAGAPLDVLRTEADEAAARATLVAGDEALLQAREALGLALGFREPVGVPPTISLDEIDATVKNICAPTPLEDRADIKKARNDIEIARRNITDAWLQFSPTATLSSTASVASVEQATSDKLGAWNVVGVLTVPFWEGGARYGSLKIAKVQHEEAKLALEAAIRAADISVQQALRSVSVAERERNVSLHARDVTKQIAHLTLRSFQVGQGTSFDVVLAAQNERAAELDLVAKDFALIQAKLQAVLALANCAY